MQAVLCRDLGTVEQLVVEDVPMPEPGPGQVRIRLFAAGLNFADTLMVAGKYQLKPQLPFVPGVEGAGVVDACGANVDGVHEGDRVVAYVLYGAFAEYVVGRQSRFPDARYYELQRRRLVRSGLWDVPSRASGPR